MNPKVLVFIINHETEKDIFVHVNGLNSEALNEEYIYGEERKGCIAAQVRVIHY